MKLEQVNSNRFNRQIDLYNVARGDKLDGGSLPIGSDYMLDVWAEVLEWKNWQAMQDRASHDTAVVYRKFLMHYDSGINVDMYVKFEKNFYRVVVVENVESADWFVLLSCAGLVE